MSIALLLSIALAMCIVAVALYGIAFKPSIAKKIIAINVLSDAVCLTLVLIGYSEHGLWGARAPITTLNPPFVNPLPQALVLTGIVIGAAVCLFACALCISVYRAYSTLDVERIKEVLSREL